MAVTTERRGPVLVIHLDDGRVNAVTFELAAALIGAVRTAEADPDIKAVVVHGRPDRFSGGFDLKVMSGADAEAVRNLAADGAMTTHALYDVNLPVVIACTGHAIAMGALLLCGGDVRIGAEGSYKIGMNELAIGLPLPNWPLLILLERINRARLQEATMAARLYTPREAIEVGFLDEVVEPDQVLSRAIEVATDLAEKIDPRAYAVTKRALRGTMLDALAADAAAFRVTGAF